ncbi:hypothetical protein KCM76_25270 [Zooshikella marina]|uniref:hypothetical protein n=1 Tax=Zooshikella ganghwensis TaxID=202772 RepID=UPI001BAFD2DE|nr:hypothetical protein [Zooshikella ganghwensis]MBU2709331.1 hypothetical protein [Zooshikella ganghwensis]
MKRLKMDLNTFTRLHSYGFWGFSDDLKSNMGLLENKVVYSTFKVLEHEINIKTDLRAGKTVITSKTHGVINR